MYASVRSLQAPGQRKNVSSSTKMPPASRQLRLCPQISVIGSRSIARHSSRPFCSPIFNLLPTALVLFRGLNVGYGKLRWFHQLFSVFMTTSNCLWSCFIAVLSGKLSEHGCALLPLLDIQAYCAVSVLNGCQLIRYDTIRDAISTCARKPTWVGLIYRTETTTKNCKTEKLKSKNRYARSNSKSRRNHVVSPEEEKERLQWEGFAEKAGFKSGMKDCGWWKTNNNKCNC